MTDEKRTAEYFASLQKEISISEFFEKNKHLLGFDNPTKALLMVVKEAVDNALDACEEARIMPEIKVKMKQVKEDIFRVSVEDNGPGIVKAQVPKVYGKLLYGSKFHRMKQSMGQQGIGISAAVLYSQLTNGTPTRVFSKTENDRSTNVFHILIDTMKNEAEIVKEESISDVRDAISEHGVRVEMDVKGRYRKTQGVDDYLAQISISNSFAKITYTAPDGEKMSFYGGVDRLPKEPKEMKPHPYGVEFGVLLRLLKNTKSRTVVSFLQNEFSSVGATGAAEIVRHAKLDAKADPSKLERDDIEKMLNGIQKTKLQRPPLDCLSPIGKEALEKGLRKKYANAEFIVTTSRSPEVYRGIPFQIECAIVYGGDLPKEDTVTLMRFANRVPLLYQAGACAVNEAVTATSWRRYGLQQSGSSMPTGPCVILVHMASAWVPFVSESKEAIAPYPDIVKEMKLAVQECARQMCMHIRRKERAKHETKRLHIFEDYFPLIVEAAAELAELKSKPNYKPLLEHVVKKGLIEDKEEKVEGGKLSGGGDD